jgi:hypothetical protein
MPSPPKGKRVRTNDRPGLIGKQGRRSKAEVAADKAAKVAKATIATTTEKRALTELAELELEQAKTGTARCEAVIHRYRTNDEDHDRLQAEADTGEDLTGLIDKEMEVFDDDDDGSDSESSASDDDDVESGGKKGMSKKVSYTKSLVKGHSENIYIEARSQKESAVGKGRSQEEGHSTDEKSYGKKAVSHMLDV